jgi:hypothetical protein
MKLIVYTRHSDGGVSICCPAPEVLRIMTTGGGLWRNQSRGQMEAQVERQIAAGHQAHAARRFVHALQFGGCSEPEALAVIRDRDCAHLGTGIELWDADEVPGDRWFRDAWRRSPNGGPIDIDLPRARQLQWRHIRRHAEEMAHRHRDDLYSEKPPGIPFGALKDRILSAHDVTALRAIWPFK